MLEAANLLDTLVITVIQKVSTSILEKQVCVKKNVG